MIAAPFAADPFGELRPDDCPPIGARVRLDDGTRGELALYRTFGEGRLWWLRLDTGELLGGVAGDRIAAVLPR